ncbi:hypothetical protein [Vibrio hangzhouensis]|uniref:Uncharacterized protein n=1 Tax=Vibrio hangzhouensis TaxID=462991 RepID=A0A1H5YBV5_9VIBR|nr:hypothetical protein [Vibrio hangzhouensis]SEG21454.1 hypothetical protein SAMN04488244_1096 [Vibrio hangzhouensis]
MEWFNDILETGGEILGGAMDTVGDFSDEWLGVKLGNELDRAESSNPDEQRKYQNDYQERDGNVIAQANPMQNYLLIGAGMLIVGGAVYLALKKGG